MDFKRILIVKLSSIGDVVHTLPVLSALRKKYPESYIAWVVKKKAADIIIDHPHLNEIILYEGIRKTAQRLRSLKFDLVIDLQGLFRSGLLTFLSGSKTRLGFSRANSRELSYLFLNQRVTPGEEDRHVIDKNLSLLRPLGIDTKEKEFIIPVFNENREYIAHFLKGEGIVPSDSLVALNPGASWPSKLWPEEKWAELADCLIEKLRTKIIFLWGPGEKEVVDRIVAKMKNKPIISCKTNLKELTCLISECKLFVGGETGPLHIACALNIPSVALIGPTDSIRNGPYGEGHMVIEKDLPCRGCWRHECKRLDCMRLITVDEVFSAIERELTRI
jgi:lipopolysaccharide heptosyltransferase I